MPRRSRIAVVVLLLLVVLNALLVWQALRDDPPVDEASLLTKPLDATDDGYRDLERALAMVEDNWGPYSHSRFFPRHMAGKTAAQVEEWLAMGDGEYLESLVAAARARAIRIPPPPDHSHSRYLSAVLHSLSLKSQLCLYREDPDGAVHHALDAVRLCLRVSEGSDGTYTWATATRTLSHLFRNIERSAGHPVYTVAHHQQLLEGLLAMEVSSDGYRRALYADYVYFTQVVDEFPRRMGAPTEFGGFDPEDHGDVRPNSFNFKPNRTKRIRARSTRRWIANGSGFFADGNRTESEPVRDGAWTWLRGNALGREMERDPPRGADSPDWQQNHRLLFLGRTLRVGTAVVLALKLFELENGTVPSTLSGLTPEYLPEVPLDPFDGEPLRYRPEQRRVYSVGSDLRDAGGQGAKERQREPALVVPTSSRFLADRITRGILDGKQDAAFGAALDRIETVLWDDASGLNTISWTIVDPDGEVENRDLDLALQLAVRANELTESRNGAILDTLARVHFRLGNLDRAIELQTTAETVPGSEAMRRKLERTLDDYQREAAFAD